MKHYDISRSVSSFAPKFQQSSLDDLSEEYDPSGERTIPDDHNTLSVRKRKVVFNVYIDKLSVPVLIIA